jgi:hypothetical protein
MATAIVLCVVCLQPDDSLSSGAVAICVLTKDIRPHIPKDDYFIIYIKSGPMSSEM